MKYSPLFWVIFVLFVSTWFLSYDFHYVCYDFFIIIFCYCLLHEWMHTVHAMEIIATMTTQNGHNVKCFCSTIIARLVVWLLIVQKIILTIDTWNFVLNFKGRCWVVWKKNTKWRNEHKWTFRHNNFRKLHYLSF